MHRLRALSDTLRASFFFLPAVTVVVAFVAGRLAVGVDVGKWVGDATVDSARAVLATVASATITFASISFSVSLLIMQQGSSQFSPRVIHGLTRDPFNRRVIAFVLATFTYCLVVLQRVRGPLTDDGEEVVPRFAVAAGLVLGVFAVLAVAAAIHHTSRQLDVSEILGGIVDEAVRALETPVIDELQRVETTTEPPSGTPSTVVRFTGDGWVRQIDRADLLGAATPGSVVRLETETGRYAIRSTALCTIWPAVPADRLDAVTDEIRGTVRLGPTRTMSEDSGYGIRQLVDVAIKALSPGVNDPTTAQDAIFHLGTVLAARLTSPPVPTGYEDEHGRRLLAPHAMTDDELAELAVAELRRDAADRPAVCVYLLEMIADVVDAARSNGAASRVAPFLEQARLLLAAAEAAGGLDHDRRRVRRSFEQRFGAWQE